MTSEGKKLTFSKAVHDKYLTTSTPLQSDVKVEILFSPRRTSAVSESGDPPLPQIVGLDMLGITEAGDCQSLHEICHDVRELDLAQNHLCDWFEVSKILELMPKITFLNLSENPLASDLPWQPKEVCDHHIDNVSSLPSPSAAFIDNQLKTSVPIEILSPDPQSLPIVCDKDSCYSNDVNPALSSKIVLDLDHSDANSMKSKSANGNEDLVSESVANCHGNGEEMKELYLSKLLAEEGSLLNEFKQELPALPSALAMKREFVFISKLILNSTLIPWPVVMSLLEMMPNVTELHLSKNRYATVALSVTNRYANLTCLYVNSNEISQWEDICKIGRSFPNLERLSLLENPIVTFGSDADSEFFANLVSINVSKTLIGSWRELEILSHFAKLSQMRFLEIPLLEPFDKDIRRQMGIAYLPRVSHLNGSKVDEKERESAERAFIRRFADEVEKPSRYFELEQKHGRLAPLVDIDLSISNNASVLVNFDGKKIMKTVNLNWSLVVMKRQLIDFVGVPSAKFTLYHDSDDGQGSDQMKYPERTLLRYGVKDGHEFHVRLK